MASKVKFIRKYKRFGVDFYDVIREKNCNTYTEDELPKTAKVYMENANSVRNQVDHFHGDETIYEMK